LMVSMMETINSIRVNPLWRFILAPRDTGPS
jgi:hypothetical protein